MMTSRAFSTGNQTGYRASVAPNLAVAGGDAIASHCIQCAGRDEQTQVCSRHRLASLPSCRFVAPTRSLRCQSFGAQSGADGAMRLRCCCWLPRGPGLHRLQRHWRRAPNRRPISNSRPGSRAGALFERRSRALLLSPKGRQFLTAVRTAMRQLDDAIEDLDQREPRGPLRVASVTAVLSDLIAPALHSLGQRYPDLRPQLLSKVDSVVARLLAGELDVAFLHDGIALPGIHSERIANLPRSVYCSSDHPLARHPQVTTELLADFAFVTATADHHGHTLDGWPSNWPRQIALQTDLLTIGYEMCRSGAMLAVLPDLLAERGDRRLCRLPIEGCSGLELHAVRRTGETLVGRADARLITAVRDRLAAATTTASGNTGAIPP